MEKRRDQESKRRQKLEEKKQAKLTKVEQTENEQMSKEDKLEDRPFVKKQEQGVKINVGYQDYSITDLPEAEEAAMAPVDEETYLKYATDCSGPKKKGLICYGDAQMQADDTEISEEGTYKVKHQNEKFSIDATPKVFVKPGVTEEE